MRITPLKTSNSLCFSFTQKSYLALLNLKTLEMPIMPVCWWHRGRKNIDVWECFHLAWELTAVLDPEISSSVRLGSTEDQYFMPHYKSPSGLFSLNYLNFSLVKLLLSLSTCSVWLRVFLTLNKISSLLHRSHLPRSLSTPTKLA